MKEIFRVFSHSSTHLWRSGQGEEDFTRHLAFHEPAVQFWVGSQFLSAKPRTVMRCARGPVQSVKLIEIRLLRCYLLCHGCELHQDERGGQ
jgi:hypothetical protein